MTYDLKYSNYSYDELAELYGISKTHVKFINAGRSWHRDYLTYPIRTIQFSGDDDTYKKIQNDLLSTTIDFEILAEKYKCSLATIRRVNSGETKHDDNLKYPLRKIGKLSSEDVYVIHQLLLDNELSINEIADMFSVSDASIKRINSGKTKKYIDNRFTYPLRK